MELAPKSAHLAPEIPRLLGVATELLLGTRALHLVDVENLLGGTAFSERDVADTAAVYVELAQVATRDHVVIASSHHTAYPTWMGWPKAGRRVVRSGPDGADHALLD